MDPNVDSTVRTHVPDQARATKRSLKRSKLVVTKGPDRGRELLVEQPRVTIGRSAICDLVLETDKSVSGTHFEMFATDQGVAVRDMGSTNGSYVNGVRFRELFAGPGMVIDVGQSSICYEPVQGEVEIALFDNDRFFELVGKSVPMREIFASLAKAAPSDLTVLIRGETGTGKELVARALHHASRRHDGPLVVQDCSAIPKDLIESTLFGHERGAFTGALDRRRGSFEQAEGGTVFLDEIGELDLALQPKLLRVLENREIKRLGADHPQSINVRVVAATNRDLRKMVNDGQFREDLYYRLSVVQVELPPLRERIEDIPLLVEEFLTDLSSRRPAGGKTAPFQVSAEGMRRLVTFSWPGNIRELKNTLERAASFAEGSVLEVHDLIPISQKTGRPALPGGKSAEAFVDEQVPFKEAKQRVVDAFEGAYLKALLDKHGGNVSRSAHAAGLTRYHLRELAKRYGVRDPSGP